MRLGYFVRPRADQDMDEIADYLSDQGGLDIGLLFLSEVFGTFTLLAAQPEIGWNCRIRHPELRSARVLRVSERFGKYLIFYDARGGEVEIIRVIHGAQDLEALFGKDQ